MATMLARGAPAATIAATVGVTTSVSKQSSNGVLACRGSSSFTGKLFSQTKTTSSRTRAGPVRVSNVAAPVKDAQAANVASKENARPVFPFTAIVGQEEMKMCLILNVIDPKIGGVMIMGDRGTGKSTTVRALVDLLPEIKVVAGDPFNSSPEDPELMSEEVRKRVQNKENLPVTTSRINMVDLPLGATEDRVCGTIDIEKALTEGVKAFEPGLLAKANRGILYVDEVNLLDDHLVDVLLDSAASGWNTVEREGISISHPARFILIGSGNPEEGELRPQLLDRFGMHAQVRRIFRTCVLILHCCDVHLHTDSPALPRDFPSSNCSCATVNSLHSSTLQIACILCIPRFLHYCDVLCIQRLLLCRGILCFHILMCCRKFLQFQYSSNCVHYLHSAFLVLP